LLVISQLGQTLGQYIAENLINIREKVVDWFFEDIEIVEYWCKLNE
jgi:hypothetical protein